MKALTSGIAANCETEAFTTALLNSASLKTLPFKAKKAELPEIKVESLILLRELFTAWVSSGLTKP